MARLQMHVLRRVCSFSNSSSVELLGAAWNRRFSAHALNGVTFSRSSVNDERRIWQVLSRGDVLGRFEAKYCGSGIRTLTSIEGGKEGKEEEKLHHSTKIDGGKKYSVVQIDSDGSWRTVWRNAVELGIHPRDVSILAASNPFISQRSTIAVHNEKIMVRMENVRALLCRDHVLLFDARRPRSFKDRDIVGAAPSIAKEQEKAAERARELFAVYMSQQAREPIGHVLDAMPFHLRMLECLLDDTSTFFYQKAERLKVVVERMLEELTGDVNMGGLQRLLPLKRALTEVEHDVRDTHEAMEEVLSSDEMLEAICLNHTEWSFGKATDESGNEDPCQLTLRQAAADMILTYQRQIDNAGGALEELRKNIVATQEIWELGLDTTRNRIIQMDVLFSLGTLSISVAALIAGYFGMNLPHGWEENSSAFWWVVFGSMGTTFALGTFLVFVVRVWPRVIDRRRARELAGLRDLLQHLDDIDDIFQAVAREVAGRAVTPKEFKKILHSHPTAKFMRQRELDIMFRMFDTDRDGVLRDSEFEGKNNKKDSIK
ncbi:hypothetical protein M758_1G268200 [Ceratodon purpureus]|uniref:Magnesium transporter n=1 Tax=Ceratodon purpureus TaxID=3225 RepID=A0A8T0J9X9_CERPU|nr:hypothetical protein KC19_1G276100 [Ceratodon purpureus]KAG0631629.1 hypothetical protein M758_1G268200 [Ceratodon purpureus]